MTYETRFIAVVLDPDWELNKRKLKAFLALSNGSHPLGRHWAQMNALLNPYHHRNTPSHACL